MSTYSDPALILPGAVDTTELADGAVTNAKVDAAAAIAATKLALPSNLSVIGSGNYTGDGTQNRAIPHGLGASPKFVYIIDNTNNLMFFNLSSTEMLRPDANEYTVTAWDSTNFYVGQAAGAQGNTNAVVYRWVAFA